MRRLFIMLFACIAMSVYAQEVEKEFDCYVQTRIGGPYSENILVGLPKLEGYRNIGTILDENKQNIKIKGLIEILNYFSMRDWEYVMQFTEIMSGSAYTWYVFKKKVKSVRQVYEEFPLHSNVDGPQH